VAPEKIENAYARSPFVLQARAPLNPKPGLWRPCAGLLGTCRRLRLRGGRLCSASAFGL
jgi:hypothetical protein